MENFEPRVLALDCSPTGNGRTRRALEAVLGAAAEQGASCSLITVAEDGVEAAQRAVLAADAFVLGSPMWRASYAAPFKALLDVIPRGMWGEKDAPLTGRAVALVGTGASLHHFLGLADMRNVLVDFFAAHVLSPGVYVPSEGFGEDGLLVNPFLERARGQGRALVALAAAIDQAPALSGVVPQA